MSDTLVPIRSGVTAGTHQNLKILGTTGLGLGFEIWVLMRTDQIKNVGSDAVPGTDQISIHSDPWLKHL